MKKHRIALIALALSAVAYAETPLGDLPMAPDECMSKHMAEIPGKGAAALYRPAAMDRGHMPANVLPDASEPFNLPPLPRPRHDAKFKPRLIAEEGRYELIATSATIINGRKQPAEIQYDLAFIGTRLMEVRPNVCQRSVTSLTDKTRLGVIDLLTTEVRTTPAACPVNE